jgi:hypothetical protein
VNLKRYQKTRDRLGRSPLEACKSDQFVAFWSDHKYVSARDSAGVEWLLNRGTSLRDIEAGDDSLMRIHRSCLVRRDSVDLLLHTRYENDIDGFRVVRVLGHENRFARSYWCQLMKLRREDGAQKIKVETR